MPDSASREPLPGMTLAPKVRFDVGIASLAILHLWKVFEEEQLVWSVILESPGRR